MTLVEIEALIALVGSDVVWGMLTMDEQTEVYAAYRDGGRRGAKQIVADILSRREALSPGDGHEANV